MSKTIDERVLSMQFDNKQFEKATQESMSTLDKLKQKLKLTDAVKGLENVDSAAKRVDMRGLGNAVETVQTKFSALQVMGVTALANITNQAVNAGKRIVSALTIDPIKTGFQEYETKIGSIQTIMSNTASKGTTMADVTRVLDELNLYADKTIYNFAEMTRNIGTFTAAGIGLNESASAIQGIANLAAASGSTSQQASTAMYQLSQALAAGTVKLMDWNSVVNAGMGGQKFQEALKATARDHGVAVDDMIKKNGSFRESLQEGWITADILNETLSKFTVDGAKKYANAMVESGKWTREQADALVKEAQSMEDAATKVKTLTQLYDTLKEAAQSGWSQSWEIIVGDFEEAKELFTEVSDTIGELIGKSAESRNKLLQGWKDLGGRTAVIDALRNSFEGIMRITTPISQAFREIFPPITAQQLVKFSEGLRDLTEKFKINMTQADKLKSIFKGLFSILDIGKQAITAVIKPLAEFATGGTVGSIADVLLSAGAAVGDFFTKLDKGIKTGDAFSVITDGISLALNGLSDAVSFVLKGFDGFGDKLSNLGTALGKVFSSIKDTVSNVFTWIADNISVGDIFAGLAGSGIFMVAKKLSGILGKIKDIFENFSGKGKEAATGFRDILESLNDSLSAFTQGIKVASLVGIAGAVMMLASAMRTISEIEPAKVAYSLVAIGLMIKSLNGGFKSIAKTLTKYPTKGVISAGISMMALAEGVNILASAMQKLSELSLPQIAKGLIGVGGSLLGLSLAMKAISKGGGVTLRTSAAILALAEACKIMADTLVKFGSMSWDEIGRGLTAMGGALAEFVGSLTLLNKFGGGVKSLLGSVGLLIAAQSLDEISENLKRLGSMSWEAIGKGLSAMGGALGEFTIALSVLSEVGGFGSVLGGTGLLIAVQSLDEISENLKRLGSMSWEAIGKGLSAMGGALGEFTIALSVLSEVGGFGSVLGGTGLLIAVQSLDEISENLKRLGSMSWEAIGKGLSAMGGALGEIGIAAGGLGKLTGLSGLLGSGTILLAVQSLDDIATAMQSFGTMSWDEIGKGLTAMGGALLEISSIVGPLGDLAGLSGIIGSGAILVSVQGLDQLATALQKFGSMNWDEIGRGLTAMVGALGELAIVSGALGSLTGLSGLVGSGSLLLGVQGLEQLATALQKFGSMNWDEIGHGLVAMGGALGEVALGGVLNTLSGLGAMSISAIAEPLGVLADSLKKWAGVEIPPMLGIQLGILADGIMKFTFGGLGAVTLAEMAAPLGTLADSVNKWSGVIVPENLGNQLCILADGVKAFTFGGLGAETLSSAAPGIGQLADAVNKWSGVTIPANLSTNLVGLADGVKAFSFAFMGGWSLDAVTGPLGTLASSVKKWNGVTIPENIKTGLGNLADGVKAFSFAFMGGWSLSAINGPLGELASAVKKWNGVAVPSNIQSSLQSLANGIKAFSEIDTSSLSAKASEFKAAGEAMATGLASGFKAGSSSINSAITQTLQQAVSHVNSKRSQFLQLGQQVMTAFARGITASSGAVRNAVSTVVSSAASGISANVGSFISAGNYLGSGLVIGIQSQTSAAYNAGFALGQAAVAGEKAGQQSHSPSKATIKAGKWLGEGLIIGMDKMSGKVDNSAYGLGSNATKSMNRAVSRITDTINGDMNLSPTITPVVNLDNVNRGVGAINRMFGYRPSLGTVSSANAINISMSKRQNGTNNDVISAINDLGKSLNNRDMGNTYNVNGITYDDGSNISSAVETLIRAAGIERRM